MNQTKRYVICPNCKTKLYKEDLILFLDFNVIINKLVAKAVICQICGYKLKVIRYDEKEKPQANC